MTFKLPLLVSYAYATQGIFDVLTRHRRDIELLVDCGAFTAWTTGKEFKLDDYCEFIKSLPFKPFGYFALDVIGDPKETKSNFDKMRRRKLTPIPIITRNETDEGMRYYLARSPLVALGGVTTKDMAAAAWVSKALRVCPRERVHILGLTSTRLLKHFKPYSVDSSSWASTARYGDLRFPRPNGNITLIKRTDFNKRPPEWVLRMIRQLGYSPLDVADERAWRDSDGKTRWLGAALAALRSRQVSERLGTKLFLACSQEVQLNQLVGAIGRLR